jgi:centractin
MRKAGHNLHTTAEKEIVRSIKEKCCYIALSPAKEEKENVGRQEEYKLPDGNSVLVCAILQTSLLTDLLSIAGR